MVHALYQSRASPLLTALRFSDIFLSYHPIFSEPLLIPLHIHIPVNQQNIILLQNLYSQYLNEKNSDKKMNNYIRHILYDRKKAEIRNVDNHFNINLKNDINTKEEMSLKYFEPNFLSFYPNVNNKKFLEKEPIWIMPNLKHNFNWENNV